MTTSTLTTSRPGRVAAAGMLLLAAGISTACEDTTYRSTAPQGAAAGAAADGAPTGPGVGHSQSALGKARDSAEGTRDRFDAHNQEIDDAVGDITGR